MEEAVRDAVFGNVGTTVAFRVGPFDAETLETIFLPRFTKEDLSSLDKRQIYLSLMIDGVGSAPFSAVTIPPIEAPPISYREQVLASSREQFTAVRAGVEKIIVEELSASTASEAPFDARMKKKPVRPVPHVSTPTFVPRQTISLPRPVQSVPHPPAPLPPRTVQPTPRPPVVHSVPPQKTAEDLKTILRNMTAKAGVEKEQKQTQNQQSLKGTLTDVLSKNKQPFEVSEDKLRDVLKGDI